jgi:hypothetical protein
VAKLPQIDEAAEISPYGHDDGSEEVVDSLLYRPSWRVCRRLDGEGANITPRNL